MLALVGLLLMQKITHGQNQSGTEVILIVQQKCAEKEGVSSEAPQLLQSSLVSLFRFSIGGGSLCCLCLSFLFCLFPSGF